MSAILVVLFELSAVLSVVLIKATVGISPPRSSRVPHLLEGVDEAWLWPRGVCQVEYGSGRGNAATCNDMTIDSGTQIKAPRVYPMSRSRASRCAPKPGRLRPEVRAGLES